MSGPEAKKDDHATGHAPAITPWKGVFLAFVVLILIPVGMNSCSTEVSVASAKMQSNAMAIINSMSLIGHFVSGAILILIVAIIIKHYATK